MLHLTLYLFTTLKLALVVWGGQTHSPVLPDLPPPPTFTPVVNNSLTVIIGGSATVREDQEVIIDCGPLIDNVWNLTGIYPAVTWNKNGIILTNGSEQNVVISQDNRFCIITVTSLARGGELGTSGKYTCRVCGDDGTADCIFDTSHQVVCGTPHLVPPTAPPTVNPGFIILTCGQDVTVPTLVGVSSITILCQIFNGSEPLTITVYKDGIIVENSVPHTITNPEFGTYTVVVSTELCGTASAVSRILQQGTPPNINKTMTEKPTAVSENRRVNVGSLVKISVGFNLTIDCTVAGTPPIIISWIHNNEIIELSEGSSSITITADDCDNITCRADNNIGYDMATTTINVEVVYVKFDEEEYIVHEDDGLLEVVLSLDKETDVDIFIQVGDTNYTATGNGVDYDSGPYNITFKKGTNTTSFFVNIIDDRELELDEDFNLTIIISLSDCVNLGSIHTVRVTILDNEYTFCFDRPIYFFEESVGEVVLPLKLSRPLRKNITVSFTYSDFTTIGNHTANQNIDYYTSFSLPNRAMISLYSTEFLLKLKIEDDRTLEDNEILRIYVDPPEIPDGYSPCTVDIIISDNDNFRFTFEEATYFVREGHEVAVKLLLTYPEGYNSNLFFPVDVTVDEIDITAIGGSSDDVNGADYVYQNYSLSFKDGETNKTLIIRTIDDNIVESDETYYLTVKTGGRQLGYFIVGTTTITILNDDAVINCSVTMVHGNIKHNNKRKRTRLRFSSDGDPKVTYECKLNDKKFKDCKSPMVWKNLKKGRHAITVRAFCTDDEGKRSTVARRKFTFQIR